MPIRAVADCDICKQEFRLNLEEGRRGGFYDPGDNGVEIALNLKSGDDYDFQFDTVCRPCRAAIKSAITKAITALKPSQVKVNKQAGRKTK